MDGPAVIVALGSNLGDSLSLLHEAATRLAEFAHGPIWKSSIWQTSPVNCPPGSPPFVNAAVGFLPRLALTPEALLPELHRIEKDLGRERSGAVNQPRTLDLDLIAFGEETRSGPHLILPHPRAHLRRFVLAPMNEIAPEMVLPGQTRAVRDLLAALPNTEEARRVEHPW